MMRRDEKGITLIALIITIIVMLILVAVTISVTVSSGIFNKAGDATKGWQGAEENEGKVDEQITSEGVSGLQNIVNHYVDGGE